MATSIDDNEAAGNSGKLLVKMSTCQYTRLIEKIECCQKKGFENHIEYYIYSRNCWGMRYKEFIKQDESEWMNAENCKFCNEGNDIITIMNQGVALNRKIYEDENFYVTVSVGALLEGHLLIISKKHYLSAGEFEQSIMRKFLHLQKKLIQVLKQKYNKEVISFEHGTGKLAVTSAASVTHAHVHLVPVEDSLIPEIKEKDCVIISMKSISDLHKCAELGESYIFYQDIDEKLYLVEKKEKQSQFLRKLICDKYNLGEWDWHKDYKDDNIIKTLERFNMISK